MGMKITGSYKLFENLSSKSSILIDLAHRILERRSIQDSAWGSGKSWPTLRS
jgi:hypothetical protein